MYATNTTLNVSASLQQVPCTDYGYVPSSRQWFQELSQAERVIIIACCVLALITTAVYSEHAYFLQQFKSHWSDRRASLWILGVLPVTSISSALSLCLPRLAGASDLISSIVLALAVLHFKLEVLDHFGDISTVVQALKSVRIPVSTAPFCFFRSCCPSFQITRLRYRVIVCCVLQTAIIQPLTAIFSLALFMENMCHFRQMTTQNPDFTFTVVRCVSTLLGVYGLNVAVGATEPVWKPLDLTLKCAVLVAWLSLFNLQALTLSLLVMQDIPACTGHLSSRVRGQAIINMLLVLEMLVISALARYSYHHNFDLNPMERDQFTDRKELESQEMSGIEDRSWTDSIDTETDVWASPGITDSSLFLTDSSVTPRLCKVGRNVVTNYGAITGPSDGRTGQEVTADISFEDVNTSLEQTTDKQE